MTQYEELLEQANCANVTVLEEHDLTGTRLKGLYCDNFIALSSELHTRTEKACVLAEELGHYYTSTGDILDQSSVSNRKQEARARLWGYKHMVTIEKLISAKRAGCRNSYEIAEHIGTTKEYFLEAIEKYKSIYGMCMQQEDYLVLFEPCFNILQIV